MYRSYLDFSSVPRLQLFSGTYITYLGTGTHNVGKFFPTGTYLTDAERFLNCIFFYSGSPAGPPGQGMDPKGFGHQNK